MPAGETNVPKILPKGVFILYTYKALILAREEHLNYLCINRYLKT